MKNIEVVADYHAPATEEQKKKWKIAELDEKYVDLDRVTTLAGYKARNRIQRYGLLTLGALRAYPAHLILQWESIGAMKLMRLQEYVYGLYDAREVGEAVINSPLFDGWVPGAADMLPKYTTHPVMPVAEFRAKREVKISRNIGMMLDDLQRADKARPCIDEWDIAVSYQKYPGERANVARLLTRMRAVNAPEVFLCWERLRGSSLMSLLALDGIRQPETVVALTELARRHYIIYDSLLMAEHSPLFVTVDEWLAAQK